MKAAWMGECMPRLEDTIKFPKEDQGIDFRNPLTHEYQKVSNSVVWGAIQVDLPELVQHCNQLLTQLQGGNV
jgi:uncharacterized protein with HEPN domain